MSTTHIPQRYAYVRVSREEQHEDRQSIALEPLNIPPGNIYVEKQSGKDFQRKEYRKLMRKLKPGDLLIIKEVDRLGRNYAEIIDQWRHITKEKGADIKVLDMPLLDTTYCKDLLGTFIADLVLQVLSFSAQSERDNLLKRQAEGIAAAHAKGVKFGRSAAVLPDGFEEIYARWRCGELDHGQAAALCGFSVRTLYNVTANRREAERTS
ncbi:MAG: recombinase family protein [Oscillospiraceae bacterium]|nr:recombinase family protein [Oscillospiraceae bacterium]